MMRILHVLPTRSPEYGGPVTVAEQLVNELCRRGVQASLFPGDEHIRDRLSLFTTWNTLVRAINATDLVHIHGLWNIPGTIAAHAARRRGIPYVVTPHGMLDRWALRRSRFKKTVYAILFEQKNLREASMVHFLNNEELAEAQEFEPRCSTIVIPNGVQVELFHSLPERTLFLRRHPECAGRIVALFLGRLHPKKGLDLLLPAFAQARRRVPELHLVIAGPNQSSYQKELEKIVKRLDINDRVTFAGMVQGENKRELLAAADFFVLTSYQEGDSMSVKEAMSAGLPIIITNACHFDEVERVGAGIVVTQKVDKISQAIETLARSENREEMGRRGAKLIEERYAWHVIVNQLLKLYEQLMHKS